MKTLVTSIALAALVATSGLATAAPPMSHQVIVNGQVVGADPDAFIRGALIKESVPLGD
jgi:hypothetical protein